MQASHVTLPRTAPKGRRRILIVDDSATHRFWLEMMLEGRYDVKVAFDGQGALDCVAAFRPELVLLDVVMPGMDGHAACRALRARPDARHVPIILVTSQRDEADVEAGFSCGCTDYITKPVDQVELLAKVESWLGVATHSEEPVG